MGYTHVVKLNFYVTDVGYLPAIPVVRDEYVDSERPPASTALPVVAVSKGLRCTGSRSPGSSPGCR
jgi:enamine deaminase RidA (YjgF/YER057c/UK114 family)